MVMMTTTADMAESENAGGDVPVQGSGQLMLRRKVLHDQAIAATDQEARKFNIYVEGETGALCNALKRDLDLDFLNVQKHMKNVVQDLEQYIDSQLGKEEATEEEAEEMTSHGLVVENAPCHPRRRRVLYVKRRMLLLYADLYTAALRRLELIDAFHAKMKKLHKERKDFLEETLRKLLRDLGKIAWTTDERCATIIQRKGTDANIAIVDNLRTVAGLVSRLRCREAHRQRMVSTAFMEEWGKIIPRAAEARVASAIASITSDAFKDPPERKSLAFAILSEMVGEKLLRAVAPQGVVVPAEITKAVEHCALRCTPQPAMERYGGVGCGGLMSLVYSYLMSLALLCKSLESAKQPNKDGMPAPGGTAPTPTAWLAAWDHRPDPTPEDLQLAGPVVAQQLEEKLRPDAIVDEWQQALLLFSGRLESMQAEWVARAKLGEQSLMERVYQEMYLLHEDLRVLLEDPRDYPVLTNDEPPNEVVLQDIMGVSLRFYIAPETGGVQLEVDGVKEEPLEYVAHEAPETMLLTLRGGGRKPYQLPVPTDPTLLRNLRDLLDARAVPHNFANEELAKSFEERYKALLVEIRERQDVLTTCLPLSIPSPVPHDFTDYVEPLPDAEGEKKADRERWMQISRLANQRAQPILKELEVESSTFVSTLQHLLHQQHRKFWNEILASSSSLVPILKGAGVFLMEAADTISGVIYDHKSAMLEAELNFHDDHNKREAELKDLMKAMLQGGTQKEVTAVYTEALKVLHSTEVGYSKSFQERMALLEKYLAALKEATEQLWQSLLEKCQLQSKAAYEQVQAQKAKTEEALTQAPSVKLPKGKAAQKAVEPPPQTTKPPPAELKPVYVKTKSGQILVERRPVSDMLFGASHAEQEHAPAAPPALNEDRLSADKVEEIQQVQHQRLVGYCPQDVWHLGHSRQAMLLFLREQLLGWFEDYSSACFHAAEKQVQSKRLELETWKSERLRLHQRRAPELENEHYVPRIRQLVEAEEIKGREFGWMVKRCEQDKAALLAEVEQWKATFAKEISELAARRGGVVTCPSAAVLGVHQRATAAMVEGMKTRTGNEGYRLSQQANALPETLEREALRFKTEHCKPFDEGGMMSAEEVKKITAALDDLRKKGKEEAQEIAKKVGQVEREQLAATADEVKRYETAARHCKDDLEFIAEISEHIARAKSQANTSIMLSQEAERSLEGMVARLEDMIRTHAPRTSIDGYTSYMADNPDLADSPNRGVAAEIRAHLDNITLTGTDWDSALGPAGQQVASILRKSKQQADITLTSSLAYKLVALLDDIRKALFARGLFLGVLTHSLHFPYLSARGYLEPVPKQEEEGVAPQPAAPKGKGKVTEEPPPATPQPSDGWDSFQHTEAVISTVQKVTAQGLKEAESIINKYYTQTKGDRKPTHPDQLPPTEAEFLQMVKEKFHAIELHTQDHAASVADCYKRQVTRVLLAAQRVPQAVFTCLFNLAMQMLGSSAGAVKAIFERMYTRSMQLKRQHGAKVKGCMSNPANRATMEAIEEAERTRHEQLEKMLSVFHGVILREETVVAQRFQQRCITASATLFKLFKSLVIPDMVATVSDVVVGKHKSIKRLKKAQLREAGHRQQQQQQQQQQQPQQGKAGKGKAPEAPKKNEALKRDTASPTQNALPLLERQYVEYCGLELTTWNSYSAYVQRNPGVEVPDHLGTAKELLPPPADEHPSKNAKGKKGKEDKKTPTPTLPGDDPQFSETLEGLDEPMFKAAVHHRQQCYDLFKGLYTREQEGMAVVFEKLERQEAAWYTSWCKLLTSLRPLEG